MSAEKPETGDDDPPAEANPVDGFLDDAGRSHCLEDHVRPLRSELGQPRVQPGGSRVEDRRGSHLLRQGATCRRDLGHDHPARAEVTGPERGGQADGACADHQAGLPAPDPSHVHRVQPHGQGLDQGAQRRVDSVGKTDGLVSGTTRDVLRKGPVRVAEADGLLLEQ